MIGNKFKGLGKGLSALMGDVPPENIQTKSSPATISYLSSDFFLTNIG